MKIFNQQKLQRLKSIAPLLWVLAVMRLPLLALALILRILPYKKPDYFVADGFLIGDCVLLRPLLCSMARRGPLVYMGGAHASQILSDIKHGHIQRQWPWATYDMSARSLMRLSLTWLKIYFMQPGHTVEPRGDVRSIAFLYLACARNLTGFSFTGGRFMLRKEVLAPEVIHLEAHNALIADALGLSYDIHDMARKNESIGEGVVGLSFSGSQTLKTMPRKTAESVLKGLSARGMKMTYIQAPRDVFLAEAPNLEMLGSFGVETWQGTFADYIHRMQTLSGYIGMDSGGGHVAAMFGIPSLIFFSTQKSHYARPVASDGVVTAETSEPLSCRPCAGTECINDEFLRCLTAIPPQEIALKLYQFLDLIGKDRPRHLSISQGAQVSEWTK